MGINRAEQNPESPKNVTGRSISGSISKIVTAASVGAIFAAIFAVFAYVSASSQTAESNRAAQLNELIAPDLAWREVDRIDHIIDSQASGQALALDNQGRIVSGNEELLDGARSPVIHDGELVGYLITPGPRTLFSQIPYWVFLIGALLSALMAAIAVRRMSTVMASKIKSESDELRGVLEKMSEKSRQERLELQDAAFSDPITGLPNRNSLRRSIETDLPSMSMDAPGAFVQLDLVGFVRASDSCGPGGHRKLLAAAIQRIVSVLEDFNAAGLKTELTSLQSDNFGLFIPLCAGSRETVAAIVRRLNVAFEAPLAVDHRLINLRISAGIVMLPEDGTSTSEIFRRAELSLAQARQSLGTVGGAYKFYTPSFDRIQRGRFQLEAELRLAVSNKEFMPVFQPKIDLATGQIMGAEALARWYRKGGKVVMPGTFISVAEEIGIIDEIGRQILKASCQSAATWVRDGYAVPVAVNVSPQQFEQDDFATTVADALRSSGLPANLLELEITENMAIEDPQKVTEVMQPLREMGVRLAIDDFGTGHSNLAVLTQLPFDVFKIDRQFVSALQTDRQAPAIVEMILAMSETLGLKTVAEGIETEEQARFLRRRGCALGQGFLYSRGVSLDEFQDLLCDWQVSSTGFYRQNLG